MPPVEVLQEQAKPKPKRRVVRTHHYRRPAPKPQQRVAAQPQAPAPGNYVDYPTNGVEMSPVPGATIPVSKYPGGVSTVSSQDLARQSYTDTAEDVLQQRVPSVVIDDLQGNAFQTNIQYRGFESSPVDGVSQGLAVYENGVRINESFGDIVNFDVLPEVAMKSMSIISGNPVYGLNALGGALTIQMKNGFTYHGADMTVSGGSYGRAQGTLEIGQQSGNWAVYWGGERITDDGYRDFSGSQIRRMYGDLGFKNDRVEMHLNLTAANNDVGVTAAAPIQLLNLSWKRTFTSPQTTNNKVLMPSFNATVKLNPHWSLNGVLYYRRFEQSHVDGNVTDAAPCSDNSNYLCVDGDPAYDQNGNRMPSEVNGKPGQGELDYTSQTANSWGTSLQAVNKTTILGRHNQFLIGSSYDYGDVRFDSSAELGVFKPKFVVAGTGLFFADDPSNPDSAANNLGPRSLDTKNTYVGVYFSDTYDLTDRLTATVGGRYNYAKIQMTDLTGLDPFLNGTNTYTRFNPDAGLTYKLTPHASLYGGYSEANRAPVAAELACADPNHPCLIESFLTADPHLKQVVAHTWELGVRGDRHNVWQSHDQLQWGVGLFRTENTDDIIPEYSSTAGRGVFVNGGNTLRQGIEANIAYQTQKWRAYANYAYIRATFESNMILASANNPYADPNLCPGGSGDTACIAVHPGDYMPGIPKNRFKIGGEYWVTPKWKIGSDILAVSSQYLYGDESNQNKQLPGYMTVSLHTSYQITPRIQLYALANNIFDVHYGVYGTFFDTGAGNEGAAADPKLGANFFTNPRSITPGPPAVIYAGAKIKLW